MLKGARKPNRIATEMERTNRRLRFVIPTEIILD